MEKHLLSSQELHQLNQLSPWRSCFSFFLDWVMIAGTFQLAIQFQNIIVYFVCFILMARNQVALGILVHEAAHNRVFKSKFWNNLVGHVFAGAPIFLSLNAYRRTHLKHHRIPLTSEDPDITLIGGYPITRSSLKRKILRDLFGLSYLKFVKHFIFAARKHSNSSSEKSGVTCKHLETMSAQTELFCMVVVNILLFLVLRSAGHSLLYFGLWILPLITMVQFLLRIRGIAEHAGYHPNKNQASLSRTVVNPLQAFFFAPHQVGYHIEHHLYPSIPFFNLSKSHQILTQRNALPSGNVFSNYWNVIQELVKD